MAGGRGEVGGSGERGGGGDRDIVNANSGPHVIVVSIAPRLLQSIF